MDNLGFLQGGLGAADPPSPFYLALWLMTLLSISTESIFRQLSQIRWWITSCENNTTTVHRNSAESEFPTGGLPPPGIPPGIFLNIDIFISIFSVFPQFFHSFHNSKYRIKLRYVVHLMFLPGGVRVLVRQSPRGHF